VVEGVIYALGRMSAIVRFQCDLSFVRMSGCALHRQDC
jgi:hypothetical protein